jgi:hypothetical protein
MSAFGGKADILMGCGFMSAYDPKRTLMAGGYRCHLPKLIRPPHLERQPDVEETGPACVCLYRFLI